MKKILTSILILYMNYDVGPGVAHEVAASRAIAENKTVREAAKGAAMGALGAGIGKTVGGGFPGAIVGAAAQGAARSCEHGKGSIK